MTVIYAEVVCAPKILPIGIFLGRSLRFKITAPGKCLITKIPPAFHWKRAFSTSISKFASLWLCSEQSDWIRPRKRLGYEVNFLSTAGGMVDQCTVLTPSPQRHLALTYRPEQPIRQRGETKTDKQRTKSEYSAGFAVGT